MTLHGPTGVFEEGRGGEYEECGKDSRSQHLKESGKSHENSRESSETGKEAFRTLQRAHSEKSTIIRVQGQCRAGIQANAARTQTPESRNGSAEDKNPKCTPNRRGGKAKVYRGKVGHGGTESEAPDCRARRNVM